MSAKSTTATKSELIAYLKTITATLEASQIIDFDVKSDVEVIETTWDISIYDPPPEVKTYKPGNKTTTIRVTYL